MSIKADVTELESIRAEIKVLNNKKKKLKEKQKIVEMRISEYLKAKNQPGVKHHGVAVILEEKQCPGSKPQKERNIDAMNVLEKYGIKESDKVLKEIMDARKGGIITKESLQFKKYKDQHKN